MLQLLLKVAVRRVQMSSGDPNDKACLLRAQLPDYQRNKWPLVRGSFLNFGPQ